ncbi:MAG: ribonuclease III [Gammaproteobacteria bacterium]|nr:ribonuclease III [Gammaproteobacteria bacterium]
MTREPQRLAAALGIEFSDIELLKAALTHRSAASKNNERLEFLGDAVLGMVIAKRLFDAQPDASEGQMSRLRATLVRRNTLAEIAREWDIGEYVHLGSGELKSGGYRRASILADTTEAIIGAVYLDQGIAAAQGLVRTLFGERWSNIGDQSAEKDPKTRLQEWLQSRGLPLPDYSVVSEHGPPHAREFVVRCEVQSCGHLGDGRGPSLRAAEQAAAQTALEGLLDE